MTYHEIFVSLTLFVAAAVLEVWGGYLVWIWIKDKRSGVLGLIGGAVLFFYGIFPTLQADPSFGRVYAGYGGIFIVVSMLWGVVIDKKQPDISDYIGAAISLIGTFIIMYAPR